MTDTCVILGCGYTGRRVAERLLRRGLRVIATTRSGAPAVEGVESVHFDALKSLKPLLLVPENALVVYSIPTLTPPDLRPDSGVPLSSTWNIDPIVPILESLRDRASRLVYLSTTGVYGTHTEVDEHTPADGNSESAIARLRAEKAVQTNIASSIILRPAAIYGPDRGVHVRMQQGNFQMGGDGSNYVSRIHADDLAAHVEAALFSELGGAWPVADECPATTMEIARYCSALLNVPLPEAVEPATLHHTRRANRRVDGSAIRRALGITLQYPSYRTGIQALTI